MGLIEQLNPQIESSQPAFVYKAIQPSFTWETAVGYLQHCADNQVGEPIDIMQYKLPVADQIDSIRPVFEYLNENLTYEVIGADLYVTLTTTGISKYTSKNDVLLWNVLGTSELKLEDEERTVEQGDLIYIPANTEYILNPKEARAYVVFSLQR
jgi:hypothetical protein